MLLLSAVFSNDTGAGKTICRYFRYTSSFHCNIFGGLQPCSQRNFWSPNEIE